MNNDDDTELTVSGLGLEGSLRTKRYRLMDVVCLLSAFGIAVLCVFSYTHTIDARDAKQIITVDLKESNAKIATALSQRDEAFAQALERMAVEQKKSNQFLRELTCLMAQPPDKRPTSSDFCKRLVRDIQ